MSVSFGMLMPILFLIALPPTGLSVALSKVLFYQRVDKNSSISSSSSVALNNGGHLSVTQKSGCTFLDAPPKFPLWSTFVCRRAPLYTQYHLHVHQASPTQGYEGCAASVSVDQQQLPGETGSKMAKGGSSSQAATLVPRAPTSTGTASARAPPTAAGMRKRTCTS